MVGTSDAETESMLDDVHELSELEAELVTLEAIPSELKISNDNVLRREEA
jgi:hypothetical protein